MPGSTSVVPAVDRDFLNWMNVRDPIVTEQFAALGLSQQDANGFKQATSDANAAWAQWQAARAAFTEASANWRAVKKASRAIATNDVKKVRTFAVEQADPNKVYSIMQIPAPKVPNFGVPPGTPTGAQVALDINSGNLTVRFECNNPPGLSGTVYVIQRRTAQASNPSTFGPWQQAAITSVKKFVDASISAGTAAVQYLITAQRGTIVGTTSQPITVQFGRAASGGSGPGVGLTVIEGDYESKKAPRFAA
jgi:hypothetical protein